MLLRPDPVAHELVAYSVGSSQVEVMLGGNMAILDQCLMEVSIEAQFYSIHILKLRNISHGDLLLPVARRCVTLSHCC